MVERSVRRDLAGAGAAGKSLVLGAVLNDVSREPGRYGYGYGYSGRYYRDSEKDARA